MAKKVGIVSCYFKNNYGSMLQAYATKKVLDNNNIENETIAIENNSDFSKGKKKYYLSQITNFKFIKGKLGMVKLKVDKKLNKELGKNITTRTRKYKEFKKEYNLSMPYATYEQLGKLASEKYSDVIVGSDQLWLPVNVVADYYTLNWVPDEINKISYATSFGFSSVPKKYYEKYSSFLKRINHLSTREQSGVKIIKDVANLDAKLVCDPTLLLTKEEWEKEASSGRKYEEKYILCYFLGTNIEHRKFAERLREETGYKIVSLNHADEYVPYSDKFCDYAPYDIGPREWINLVANAEYVLTDSFHGTVFSLIFNKNFFNFRRYKATSKISTNSRLDSLLNVAGVSKERILTGDEDVKKVLEYTIDYDKVNQNLSNFREDSKKWLLNSLTYKIEEKKTIEITDKENCAGCTACKAICPKDAISMKEDNEGFLYPEIDKEKCTNCGLCKKICPIANPVKEDKKEQKAYLVNNKNEEIRSESTSGGAFTAIAEYVIDNNGVVFGATFDDKFNVHHTYVEKKEDLIKFRGSKYVQSALKDTFKEVKEFLNNDRWVCFSGTPCQIEGLKRYLGKEYKKLITVDIVCHAVPSPKFWRKYLKWQKNNLGTENINKILFRDKSKYGYKYSTMTIKTDKGIYAKGVESDPYLRAFFGDLSDRPACYNCAFKKQYRVSDFTIWDCFSVEEFDKNMDDDKGTTRILVHTSKGREIFNTIKQNFNYKEVKTEDLVKNVKEMYNSVQINVHRTEFFEDMNSMNEPEFFKKYFPDSLKVKFERRIRIFLTKTGIYKKTKKIVKKVLNK